MNHDLAAAVRRRGELAGSILGLARDRAIQECEALVAGGDRIHLDIIDAAYPLARGVDDAVIDRIPAIWWDAVDVHLMVGAMPADLGALSRAGRITVHLRSPGDLRMVERVLADRREAWVSLEPQQWTAVDVAAVIDRQPIGGVLMMLAPAAVPGAVAERSRIGSAAWEAARARVPLGVDGGVTDDLVPVLAEHGVSYFVVGRALFGDAARTAAASR